MRQNNWLNKRDKTTQGAISATVIMIYMVLTVMIMAPTILAINSFKTVNSVVTKDSTFYYADYGIEKAKGELSQVIFHSSTSQREEWLADISKFVDHVNDDFALLFEKESQDDKNFKGLTVQLVHNGDDNFELISQSYVKDKSKKLNYNRTLKTPLVGVIPAMGDRVGGMPAIDSAILAGSNAVLDRSTVKGKSIIIDPSKKDGERILITDSTNIFDSTINKNGEQLTTEGRIVIYSSDGSITEENVHEYFEFVGFPTTTGAADKLFHLEGVSPNYKFTPKEDKIEIIYGDLTFPKVNDLSIPVHLLDKPKANQGYIPHDWNGTEYEVIQDDGSLVFPSNVWSYGGKFEYKIENDAYMPEIIMRNGARHIFDVGDKNINILTDKLDMQGGIEIVGDGTLTIHLTEKAMRNPDINLKLMQTGVKAETNGAPDSKKLVLALHTPDSMESNPLKITLNSYDETSLSIIAKHLDLTVRQKANINVLSWGVNSKADIHSSSEFDSQLFYFPNGHISYSGSYYYGSLIADTVSMENTSATIEFNEHDAPTFEGFPIEIDWEKIDGTPCLPGQCGGSGSELSDPNPGKLEFGKTKGVKK